MDKDLTEEGPPASPSDRRAILLATLRSGAAVTAQLLVTLLDPHRAEADVIVGSSGCDLTTGIGCVDPGEGG